jgi:signal transduction histidine kinase
MIYTIRPPALDDLGLVAALRSQTDAFAKHTGIRCGVDLPEGEVALSPEETITVFRVAQEALTNVARHARATSVELRLAVRKDRLELLVEDDGQGVAALKEDLGLRGMRERAALLNGSFEVESRADRGTVVRLQLPRSAAAA